jgi:hypothetical protein
MTKFELLVIFIKQRLKAESKSKSFNKKATTQDWLEYHSTLIKNKKIKKPK